MSICDRITETRSGLKNSRFSTPLRLREWRKNSEREVASVRDLAGPLGIRAFETASLAMPAPTIESTPLYVFGNGSSVNSISPPDFHEIRKGFSIGTNAWPVHPFVPDIYSFEFSRHSLDPDPELAFLVALAESHRRDTGRGKFLFLRPGAPAGVRAMVPLAPDTHTGAFLYGRANLFATSRKALAADLNRLMTDIGRDRLSGLVLPDNGSSVIRMIFLGLIAGFRNINLIGVDLNDSPYFWYEQRFIDRHGDFRQMSRRSASDPLSTESTDERPFATSEFIIELATSASRVLGATITTATSESSLAGPLGVRPVSGKE